MLTPEGPSPSKAVATERPVHASPILQQKNNVMRRTPQPNLTQSKLTFMLQAQQSNPPDPPLDARRTITLDEVEMDTAATPDPAPAQVPPGGGAFLTTDLFLKAMKENRDDIISSFNATIGALSRRIEDNSAMIAANAAAIRNQGAHADGQKSDLLALTERVVRLERDGVRQPPSKPVSEARAVLSPAYSLARRSVRLWPISGNEEGAWWGEVGNFLHDTLAIRTDDICQEDIEAITRAGGAGMLNEEREVLVTFYDKKKRDLVMTHSPSLANMIDREGKPTAGIRLEIPPELNDTFRLLSRFGARLRARHGAGTKRHVKFDDFSGSLFANIKLPGDLNWTKVTPAMAREDLDASMKEEGLMTQKRLASKLMPGPRERLSRPMIGRGPSPGGPPASIAPIAGPSGKRPRGSAPDKARDK